MKILIQRSVLILLLFAFSATILRLNTFVFSDLNEELLEEIIDFEEKDNLDKYSTYEFDTAFYFSKVSNSNFFYFNDSLLNKVFTQKYCEPTLDNLFSPPELIS
ncbi:MAG: hypothetical protein V4622_03195 [Bacteroidota bacterium]